MNSPKYELNSWLDYRRIPRALSNVYFNPLNRENSIEIDKLFKSLTADSSDPVVKNRSVETWGRVLIVPESTNDVAKFRFLDLCGKPYSAADYLELTKKFSTLFLLDVPKMGMQEKDMVCFLNVARYKLLIIITGPEVYHFDRWYESNSVPLIGI